MLRFYVSSLVLTSLIILFQWYEELDRGSQLQNMPRKLQHHCHRSVQSLVPFGRFNDAFVLGDLDSWYISLYNLKYILFVQPKQLLPILWRRFLIMYVKFVNRYFVSEGWDSKKRLKSKQLMKKVMRWWVSPLITDSFLTVFLCYVLCSLILCLELQYVCPVNYYENVMRNYAV